MPKISYSKILIRSAAISVFLASSAVAQSWIGSPPREQIYISIINTPVGDGTFIPTVQIENAFGNLTQIQIGKEGLTRAILYNQEAITAWVLARYGQVQNPQVFFDNQIGNDDQEDTPPPAVEPEKDTGTKTDDKPETKPEDKTDDNTDDNTEEPPVDPDCRTPASAPITSIDDLPIISVGLVDCDVQIHPCDVSFGATGDLPMIWRIQLVPDCVDYGTGDFLQGA